MIKITLPFPDPRLNPNRSKGLHWSATSNLRQRARLAAFMLTKKELPIIPRILPASIPLSITFIQPDKRNRDTDNLLASLKPSLDGIADALGINDSQFSPITIRRKYGNPPGSVCVEIAA